MRLAPIRMGKHNISYWVDSNRGRFALLVRVAPPDGAGFLFYERLMMRQEPSLHHLIRATTAIPVAQVAGYDFSRTIINRDYLIMADRLPEELVIGQACEPGAECRPTFSHGCPQ
jgi:hypothetical protein